MVTSAIPATATMVTVACKLPHGLRLQLQRQEVQKIQGFGGQLGETTVYRHYGKTVILNGFAHEAKVSPKHPIEGGYGLTFGVDAKFMKDWLDQNAELPAVRNGLIFIHSNSSELSSIIKEHEKTRSGLEPMNPNNLPMMGIQTFNRSEARA